MSGFAHLREAAFPYCLDRGRVVIGCPKSEFCNPILFGVLPDLPLEKSSYTSASHGGVGARHAKPCATVNASFIVGYSNKQVSVIREE